MDISFCIVNLNAIKLLKNCINSIPSAVGHYSYEIIVADNNSYDGSQKYLVDNSSSVRAIFNKRNIGYTKAMNQILKSSIGKYKVVLNPDSQLMRSSVLKMIDFMKQDSMVGIVGPKIVDRYGRFQKSCRRGLATPTAVFSYFLGLPKYFPRNENFTGYHLNHLDENEINEVSGISGSCMLINGELIKEIGYFDEIYSIYQEDSDYCIRALNHGWKVYFYPQSQVMHYGGHGGTNSFPYQMIFEWHRSYIRFYFKHFSKEYSSMFNVFYLLLRVGKLIFSEIRALIQR